MRLPAPMIEGRLIRRYKRFLADVRLPDGSDITAHCPNPGSMLGLAEPGWRVWLSKSDNPKRKLAYGWELVETGAGSLVNINTNRANAVGAEAIEAGAIPELAGYGTIRREVGYGENSRVDLLLTDDRRPDCYVEIKSVTLARDGWAEFPDSVTKRGAKHLDELARMTAIGHRAVMLYLAMRGDCTRFRLARDIDPAYATAYAVATAAGVEALAHACRIAPEAIEIGAAMAIGAPRAQKPHAEYH